MSLRPGTAQGASALQQEVEFLLAGDVAFGSIGVVEQARQVDQSEKAPKIARFAGVWS